MRKTVVIVAMLLGVAAVALGQGVPKALDAPDLWGKSYWTPGGRVSTRSGAAGSSTPSIGRTPEGRAAVRHKRMRTGGVLAGLMALVAVAMLLFRGKRGDR
jgi:hypothetical protein